MLNKGFDGSTFSDLLYYQKELIFKYKPTKVFIYEGDNDISLDQDPEEVLGLARLLVQNIQDQLPKAPVYLISVKPSVVRWALKGSTRISIASYRLGLHLKTI